MMTMEFLRTNTCLKLIVTDDAVNKALQDYENAGELDSDDAMYELFGDILPYCSFRWIAPEEIGALTAAPILGIADENDKVVEAYGYMNYAVTSLLRDLFEHGEAVLQKG
ncbi:MAG: hypothetical protein JRC53_05465 [Deltaproteobacteria bacterium]|nr:hypothetical protein [Deltaproteobacteria bacterium]